MVRFPSPAPVLNLKTSPTALQTAEFWGIFGIVRLIGSHGIPGQPSILGATSRKRCAEKMLAAPKVGALRRKASTMPLTDIAIRTAKPRQKAYKLFDMQGLFVLVQPSGGKLWRLKGSAERRVGKEGGS